MSYNPYSYAPANQQQQQQQQFNGFGGIVQPQNPISARGQPMPAQSQAQAQPQTQGFPSYDPRAAMAFQIGQSAFNNFLGQENFSQLQETVQRAAGSTSNVSHYFQVSTAYVAKKTKQILLPFSNKNNWQRIPDSSNSGNNGVTTGGHGISSYTVSFLPPREDINSPDLYIPVMGLVTYILVWNIQQGLHGNFNPENLYYKLSSILAFVALDLFILKFGLYLLVTTNSPVTSILELVCYVGYKFVPLTLALFFPASPRWISLLGKTYLFIAFGVFLLRSVKFNLFNTNNDDFSAVKKSTVKKCNYFLFVYGFFWQSILMWLMG